MYIDIIRLQHLYIHSPFYPVLYKQTRGAKIRTLERRLTKMNGMKPLRLPVLPCLFILKSSTVDTNFLKASQHCQRGQQPLLCRPASDSCQCHRGRGDLQKPTKKWHRSSRKPTPTYSNTLERYQIRRIFQVDWIYPCSKGWLDMNHPITKLYNLEVPDKAQFGCCQAMWRFKDMKKIESKVAMFGLADSCHMNHECSIIRWWVLLDPWRSFQLEMASPPIRSASLSPGAPGAPNDTKTGAQVSRIQTIDLAGCARHIWMGSQMQFLMMVWTPNSSSPKSAGNGSF